MKTSKRGSLGSFWIDKGIYVQGGWLPSSPWGHRLLHPEPFRTSIKYLFIWQLICILYNKQELQGSIFFRSVSPSSKLGSLDR